MKALKFSFLLSVIIFTLSLFFASCDPVDPPDPIDPPVTKVDSVIMKINLELPDGVVVSELLLSINNPALTDGFASKLYFANERNLEFIFVKEAKNLIGTNCTIFCRMEGSINGSTATFELVGNNTFPIQKGLNQYTITYNAKEY